MVYKKKEGVLGAHALEGGHGGAVHILFTATSLDLDPGVILFRVKAIGSMVL